MPTQLGQTLLIPAKGASGWAVTPANSNVVGVGDSIMVANHNTAGGGITPDKAFQPRSINTSGPVAGFLTLACLLTGDGRANFIGTHATGGATTASVYTTHIAGSDSPLNDSPRAGSAAVLIGANDLLTICPVTTAVDPVALAAVETSAGQIIDALIAGGILPFLCAPFPSDHATQAARCRAALAALIPVLQALAARKNVPWVDTHTPISNGSYGYGSGMAQTDGIHPKLSAAYGAGAALAAKFLEVLPAASSLVTTATEADSGVVLLNGCMQRDTNSDLIPNGGNPESQAYWSVTAAGAATDIVTRSGFSGKAWRLNKTSDASGNSTANGSASGNGVVSLTDGHLYRFGFAGEIGSWSGTDTYVQISLVRTTDGSKVPVRLTLQLDGSFANPISRFELSRVFRCSTAVNMAPAGAYRPTITLGASSGAATTDNLIDWFMGQLTLIDLGVG